jgi:hypothetical protein
MAMGFPINMASMRELVEGTVMGHLYEYYYKDGGTDLYLPKEMRHEEGRGLVIDFQRFLAGDIVSSMYPTQCHRLAVVKNIPETLAKYMDTTIKVAADGKTSERLLSFLSGVSELPKSA